jgi:predicted nucleic acid-binding protein
LDRVLVDSGYLIALGRARDSLHLKADQFLSAFRGSLLTVSAVIVETCFFMDAKAKAHLLDWVAEGSLSVVEVPPAAYPDLGATIRKYADRKIDFADAALVWLAEESGVRAILTVDARDFSLFRLRGGKRFRLIDWF